MSNCSSDSLAIRLLGAAAEEGRIMAEDIARLGAQVSGGTADSAALQSFDFLSQRAHALALLVGHIARMMMGAPAIAETVVLIDLIPLPDMRRRLLRVLDRCPPTPSREDDIVLWMDG